MKVQTIKQKQIEALKDKSIKDILNQAYIILGHPIMAFDTSYNLLSNTDNIVTDDRFWNELIKSGTFSHESVNFFRDEGFIDAFAKSEILTEMNSNKLKYKRINGKLFDKDNVQLGNILVLACFKPFTDEDKALIETLCELVSTALQNSAYYKKIERVYQESLFDLIIEGNIKNKQQIKAAADLYKGLKSNIYIAVVDILEYERTATHLAYFRDVFKKIQKEYKYFVHLNNVVIILSTDKKTLNVKKELRKLNNFFIRNNLFAGISGSFQDFKETKKHYSEAVSALNYGLKSKRNQNIFIFDNYRIEHLLSTNIDSAYTNEIKNQVIDAIQQYDCENNTSYLNTLYVYMLYGRNISLAAKSLETTAKELRLKLKKLTETFGINWTDGDMLANIYLTLKMIKNTES